MFLYILKNKKKNRKKTTQPITALKDTFWGEGGGEARKFHRSHIFFPEATATKGGGASQAASPQAGLEEDGVSGHQGFQ